MSKINLGKVIGKDFAYNDFTQEQLEALKVKGDAGDNKVIVVKDGVQTREDLTLKKEGKFTTLLTGETQEAHKLLADDVLTEDGNPIMDTVNQLSNPNLLINEGFQIWQRGETFSNINEKYTADRWLVTTTGTCACVNGKLNIITTAGWCSLKQIVEANVSMRNTLIGKKVTLSYKVTSASSVAGLTCQVGNETGKKIINLNVGDNIVNLTKEITEADFNLEKNALYVNLLYGSVGALNVTVEWAKLEVGSITPFVPRSFAEELALCQRYYQAYRGLPIRMYSRDSRYYNYIFVLPTKMRKSPSVTCSQDSFVMDKDSNAVYPSPISNGLVFENADYYVCARKFSALILDTTIYFGYLYVDAEIY